MTVPFPEPNRPAASRGEVLLEYLDFFRSRLVSRIGALPAGELSRSQVPSGWTPAELLNHCAHVELRWLEWRFEGRDVAEPWGDDRDGHWHVAAGEGFERLAAALRAQAARTRAIVESHDLGEVGRPSDRWPGGGAPATLERVLLHLLQEYARHLGHLDIASELAGGQTGE